MERDLVQTLRGVVDDLRRHPATEQANIVLCLLEAAQQLLPAVVTAQQLSEADLMEVRSCVRAAEISVRSHFWRHA
ncbi:hypothetical protein [Dactylosporangium sp. NPDC051484]|uniref:hypothetical protein n=1 Tax=Dactylosporangium sp. NPDC051484 TaxID=3154942 RepID=UPI00344E1258